MDQVKVGKYIYDKRKELGLTQKELAEKIGVTDKSVSKWERGDGLPDVSRLSPLCETLNVTINELIAGEDLSEEALTQKTEENIIELIKENENRKSSNKLMVILGVILAVFALCLLGISIPGSSMQSVAYYFDPVTILSFILVTGICVLLSGIRIKGGIFESIRRFAIPSGVFIGLFRGILLMTTVVELNNLGEVISTVSLAPMYGLLVYLAASIVTGYRKEK